MYRLPCPHCQTTASVTPSQAGDEIKCDNCGQSFPIPKLGDLRKLPRADQLEDRADTSTTGDDPAGSGRRIGFILAAAVATVALLIAGFCLVRWATIQIPATTETHIAEYAKSYQTASPAMLIREFQEMEKHGLEMPVPYKYKQIERTKRRWGLNAICAGTIAAFGIVTAIGLAISERRRPGD